MRVGNIVAALVLLVGVGALAACGGDDETADDTTAGTTTTEAGGTANEDVQIALFTLATANSYNVAEIEGAKAAAAELGGTIAQVFDGKFNAEAQVAQLQDATTSGKYDAFVLLANDGNVVAPAVEDAIAKGIKVVAVYTPIGPDIDSIELQTEGLVATVANPISGNGKGLADATIDACGDADPCNVAYVSGGFTIPFEAKKFEAFKAAIAEHDQIVLKGQAEAGFLRENGYKVGQDLLQAHPDITVFVTSGDQMTFGAEQAMEDAGKSGIQFIGNGASAESVEAVCDGRWHSSYVYLPFSEAKQGTEFAIQAVRGELTEYKAIDPNAEMSTIGPFFDKPDCGTFEAEWKVG